jgi:hypothetical protein
MIAIDPQNTISCASGMSLMPIAGVRMTNAVPPPNIQ